ncbi:MAG: alpha/beta fold hydrolase [bacterium]
MPFCRVGSLRMHYHERGKGPPLVLVMGLSGDLTWWEQLARRLEDRFRLVLFDNRGAGFTDKPEQRYSIAQFASDLVGLMDALEIHRAHVFGISMGGMIAQELTLLYPGRVEGLALGCTHSGGPGMILPSAEAIQQMTLTRGKSLDEIARQVISILFSPSFQEREPGVMQAMIDRYVANPPLRKAFTSQFWAVLGHNCYERLHEIRKPTLIVTGDEDILVPPENSRILERRIPGARLVVLPGAGHAFFIEQPDETARLLAAHFLDSGGAGG